MMLQGRRFGTEEASAILCLAGFGDNGSMFESLADTRITDTHSIWAADLPGFGAPRDPAEPVTLEYCADLVDQFCRNEQISVVVAHSVASIVASLAASRPGSPIDTLISLEGNLTADDAYYSGSAAEYDEPEEFRKAFLARLDRLAEGDPIMARYRTAVAGAEPAALWELGRDARRFSEAQHPGEVLAGSAPRVTYLYNPDNCPEATLRWLERGALRAAILEGASHWPTVDHPELLAAEILQTIGEPNP